MIYSGVLCPSNRSAKKQKLAIRSYMALVPGTNRYFALEVVDVYT